MTQHKANVAAVAYVRASTDDQVGHMSLRFQERAISKWCRGEGFGLLGAFADVGSACSDDLAGQPGLRKLLGLLPILRPRVFVVYSLDRLTRNAAVASRISDELGALGMVLVSLAA